MNHVLALADFRLYDLAVAVIVVVDRLAQPVFFCERVLDFWRGILRPPKSVGGAKIARDAVSVGGAALRAKLRRVVVKVAVGILAAKTVAIVGI